MENQEKINWSALEYESKERHVDWFWTLGVIIVAGAVTSIIFANYFFAIFLIIAGSLMGFFAVKQPDMISYELNEKGLKIENQIYVYEKIKSFWIQKPIPDDEKNTKPILFIKSERPIIPIFSIPIENDLIKKIQNSMVAHNIKEEEMH